MLKIVVDLMYSKSNIQHLYDLKLIYSKSTAAVVLMTTFAVMQNRCLFSLKLATSE